MLSILSSKEKGCKNPSKPCRFSIHWTALAKNLDEYPYARASVIFLKDFLNHFVLAKLAAIRVNPFMHVAAKSNLTLRWQLSAEIVYEKISEGKNADQNSTYIFLSNYLGVYAELPLTFKTSITLSRNRLENIWRKKMLTKIQPTSFSQIEVYAVIPIISKNSITFSWKPFEKMFESKRVNQSSSYNFQVYVY